VEFKVGDLVLVKGNSIISSLIKDVQNSQYSHVAGIIKENVIIEADWDGVNYNALDYYNGMADIYRCDSLTKGKRYVLPKLAINELKDPYDYLLLIVQLIRYWFNLKLPYISVNRQQCGVLWVNIYRKLGIDLCPGQQYPSPAEISESKLLRYVGSI